MCVMINASINFHLCCSSQLSDLTFPTTVLPASFSVTDDEVEVRELSSSSANTSENNAEPRTQVCFHCALMSASGANNGRNITNSKIDRLRNNWCV